MIAVLVATACSSGNDEAGVDRTNGGGTTDGTALALPDSAETTPPGPDVSTTSAATQEQAGVATAFWEALSTGDRDTALSLVDPTLIESGAGNPAGRAETLVGQFDWFEAVGWQWALEECTVGATDMVECTATAANAWSDALGVEPVTGTFLVRFGDDGIGAVEDLANSFYGQWSPRVFEPFAAWVRANHREDAVVMFDFGEDVNSEILDLYANNTERFVEAQRDE